MFDPEGGLATYVRRKQLRRALAAVTSPANRHLRIVDIAIQHGFRTESGFIRAFRREFGATPAELRAAGGHRVRGDVRGDAESAVGPSEPRDSLGWLLDLRF
jgi:AraC-like DNA-binding protein